MIDVLNGLFDRIMIAEAETVAKLNAARPVKSAGSVLNSRETGYHVKKVFYRHKKYYCVVLIYAFIKMLRVVSLKHFL